MTSKKVLPHQSNDLFLTDGGMETTRIFLEGFDLPSFAAFDLFKDKKGSKAIWDYFQRYLKIARQFKTGFILESPTCRASPDWIQKLGYPESALIEINEKAIQLLVDLKNEYKDDQIPILISGCLGPRWDGYRPGNKMTAEEAENYHLRQIEIFSHTPLDMISALTINYVEEAIGITRASNRFNIPVVISFTVVTNGKLPTGMRLKDAVELVDGQVHEPPIYYMINSAHPSYFRAELLKGKKELWTNRFRGIKANASIKGHAELDDAMDLDGGDPKELALMFKQLKISFNQLNVFGGWWGTDDRHLLEIAKQIKSVS